MTVPVRRDAPDQTGLERNSFAVLGATTRDRHERLIELAEDRALAGNESESVAARLELTNPRTRLGAEVAWLPGVAPSRVQALLLELRQDPGIVLTMKGLPFLTVANLMAASFELITPTLPAADLAEWILRMAEVQDAIRAEEVLRDINEERVVSGFPEIRDLSLIEAALADRNRHYRDAVLAVLNRVPSRTIVEILTTVIVTTTGEGHHQAPHLVEEVGAAYELQVTEALEKGAEGLQAIIQGASEAAEGAPDSVRPYLDQIETLLYQWDALAQPVQLLMKARGLDHGDSWALANAIRSLSVELVNEHGLIDEAARLTALSSEVFAELPEIVERLGSDAATLESLASQRDGSEESRAEWEKEITYSAEVGSLFSSPLSISPDGFSWKGVSFPLDSITRVRWGALKQSVNFIPMGTTYTIAVGDEEREAICEMRDKTVWAEFVSRLNRAVGFRLTLEMLSQLKKGGELRFEDAVIKDFGVTLPRQATFGASEWVYCRWSEVQVWTADGSFYIGKSGDKRVHAGMPYLATNNVHMLEFTIRAFLKSSKSRLSEVFDR